MQGAAKCASWPTVSNRAAEWLYRLVQWCSCHYFDTCLQAVSLLLQLLPIAVMGMLLVVSFHSLPVSTAASAFRNDVWEALPGVTTTQTLSLTLVFTAISAAVAAARQSLFWCPLISG